MGGRHLYKILVILVLTLAISVVTIQAQSSAGTTGSNSATNSGTTKDSTTKKLDGTTQKDATGGTTKKDTATPGASTKKDAATPGASTKNLDGTTQKGATGASTRKDTATPGASTRKDTATPGASTKKDTATPGASTKKDTATPGASTKKDTATPGASTKKDAATSGGSTKRSDSTTKSGTKAAVTDGGTTKKATTRNTAVAKAEDEFQQQFATMTGELIKTGLVDDDWSAASIAAKNNTGAMTNTKSQWIEVAPYTGDSYDNSYGVFQSSAVLRWAFKVYFAKVRSSSDTSSTEWFMGMVSTYGRKCFRVRLHSETGMNFKQCLEMASQSKKYTDSNTNMEFSPASFYYGISDGECTLYAEWRKQKFKTCYKSRGVGETAFYFKTDQPDWWDPCGGMTITIDCTVNSSGKGVVIYVFLMKNYCICDISSVTIEFLKNGVEREFTPKDNYFEYHPNEVETAGTYYQNNSIVRVNSDDYSNSNIATTYFNCDPDVG